MFGPRLSVREPDEPRDNYVRPDYPFASLARDIRVRAKIFVSSQTR